MKKRPTSVHEQTCRRLSVRSYWLLPLIAGLVLGSCQKDLRTSDNRDAFSVNEAALKNAKASVITVRPGSSIQAAVDMASAGAVIKILPGTYKEKIIVDKPGISLIGEGSVTLENPGSIDTGIVVRDYSNGFVLRNVTIQGFKERAVQMTGVDGFTFSHITINNSGEFGIFVNYSTNGVIEHCEGIGQDETSVFVKQSNHVLITENKMHGNVIGLEAENSSYVTFDKNHVYDNAVGIFCSLVPNVLVNQSTNNVITNNHAEENNHVNFAGEGEREQILPSGTGILVLGSDNTLVQGNHVSNNRFTGIALISTTIFSLLGYPLDGIEPFTDGTKITENKLSNNGYDPQSALPFPVPGVDLLWLPELGAGTANCWSKNVYSTSYPASLPTCP